LSIFTTKYSEMRYGCCVNMVSKASDLSGLDVIATLKKTGFDYAELSLTHLNLLSSEEKVRLYNELQLHGLPAEASNNFFPAQVHLTGDRVNFSTILHYLDKCFETALFFGIKTIVFGSGGARMVPAGFPMEKALDQLAMVLLKIEPYARESRIKIAIEPLRKKECNIINTYKEACQLAAMVSKPSIGCLADSFHLYEENEPAENITHGSDYLSHVHIAYPVGRIFPQVSHFDEMSGFMQSLVSSHYKSRVSIEAFSDNLENDALEALKLLRGIERECSQKLNF
jgi:D-psicose/D-tagatose/L-ribulose 3-epimerase